MANETLKLIGDLAELWGRIKDVENNVIGIDGTRGDLRIHFFRKESLLKLGLEGKYEVRAVNSRGGKITHELSILEHGVKLFALMEQGEIRDLIRRNISFEMVEGTESVTEH